MVSMKPSLIHGDCLEKLKALKSNSVDSLVTDPPAGISFMGKAWDDDKGGRKQWIAWMAEVMSECMRVLKPGAHGLVWAIPRTSHWTATALEDAGFEIRDVVTHLFGSGFPKSLDVSKAIDKAAGVEREVIGVSSMTGARKSSFAEQRADSDSGFYGEAKVNNLTAPATDLARKWQGFGTALKPASEHWILVRKPCSEKTVAKNVEKWGCGAINIDASRIHSGSRPLREKSSDKGNDESGTFQRGSAWATGNTSQGRFPANLVFSHTPHCTELQCDIECAIKELDGQSPHNKETRTKSPAGVTSAGNGKTMGKMTRIESVNYPGEGGASRFFYCAKISKSERNAGADNAHPTVKPKKLMSYFCTMITPPGGTVLDPFMGSGSTGIAAIESGFGFTGIERDKEYFQIAKKRVFHAFPKHKRSK